MKSQLPVAGRATTDADVTSCTGPHGRRTVEPGPVELRSGRSSDDQVARIRLRLTDTEREAGHRRRPPSPARVEPVPTPASTVAEVRG
jgi:beta-xylosidase